MPTILVIKLLILYHLLNFIKNLFRDKKTLSSKKFENTKIQIKKHLFSAFIIYFFKFIYPVDIMLEQFYIIFSSTLQNVISQCGI